MNYFKIGHSLSSHTLHGSKENIVRGEIKPGFCLFCSLQNPEFDLSGGNQLSSRSTITFLNNYTHSDYQSFHFILQFYMTS